MTRRDGSAPAIGAGDASLQKKAKRRMADMAERAGIIILASHNDGLIEKTCNRALELEKERLTLTCPSSTARRWIVNWKIERSIREVALDQPQRRPCVQEPAQVRLYDH